MYISWSRCHDRQTSSRFCQSEAGPTLTVWFRQQKLDEAERDVQAGHTVILAGRIKYLSQAWSILHCLRRIGDRLDIVYQEQPLAAEQEACAPAAAASVRL